MADTPAEIIDALRSVHDPCCREKGISVVDMGLVRDVVVDDDTAKVRLILTTGWCPFAANLITRITERIEALGSVARADVEITWDEAWTTDRLSDEARAKLRFLPDPAAVADRDAYIAQRQGGQA